MRHGFREEIFQCKVDGSNGPVKINRPKQVRSCLDKIDQCRKASGMNRQSRWSEECIVQDSIQIESLRVIAGHVRIAEDEVHVVDGVDTAE